MLLDLTSKRPGDNPSPSGDRPVDLLLACHARIRHFSTLAVELTRAVAPPPGQVADAATGLQRYFATALPLHVADEETSVRPRLLEAAPRGRVADALERMIREHASHHDPLVDLLACWSALGREPSLLGELAPRLAEGQRLKEAFEAHLALEEKVIFPALVELPELVQREILVEMRSRRVPGLRP